ncbi:MAG TPA: hypothetical protein VMU33_07655 [Burkholderiaceae bacterium]|nr:hypothetical protein [Burkholderiaceae bacterium]
MARSSPTHAATAQRITLAALLCLGGMFWPPVSRAGGERTPLPAILVEGGGHCLAPAGEMRRRHPDMLKHQRDRTVHLGERGTTVNLKECVACHASRTTGSVIGSDQAFCQGCHTYAAVQLDCFECHSPKRTTAATSGPAANTIAISARAKR